jgi:tRNA pseudouridine38-40 synthase
LNTPTVVAADCPRRNFKMTVAYDGTLYAGWQVQLRRQTIQGMLEKAIAQVCRERVRVTGSGRTDSGVHAIGQVASFSLGQWRAGADDLARALNSKLPPDISIRRIVETVDDFHAIRDARGKRYRYQLRIGGNRDAFEYRYRWHLPGPIDIDAIRQAAELIRGKQDFASFQAAGSDRKTTVRDIRALDIIEQPVITTADPSVPLTCTSNLVGSTAFGGAGQGGWESSPRHIAIEVEADGFLYNMVRNIVGSLVEVGRGKYPPQWIADVIAARDRTVAGPTAPPHGLFLLWVHYPDLPEPAPNDSPAIASSAVDIQTNDQGPAPCV